MPVPGNQNRPRFRVGIVARSVTFKRRAARCGVKPANLSYRNDTAAFWRVRRPSFGAPFDISDRHNQRQVPRPLPASASCVPAPASEENTFRL